MITEIGGTVGDIESLPFLEAIRQFPVDVGRRRCMFIHLTLVPYIGHAGELKTKPTQHSVNELRRIGIQPDMVVCRSEGGLPQDIRKKIALFASLPLEAVVSARDVDNIYKVPLVLPRRGRRRLRARPLRHGGAAARPRRLGAARPPRRRGREPPAGADRARRQVRQARGRLPLGRRGAAPLRLPARLRRSRSTGWTPRRSTTTRCARGSRRPTASSSRAASACAASRARSPPRGSPASSRSPTSASAWACRWRSPSSRATSSAWTARTRPSSTRRRRTR